MDRWTEDRVIKERMDEWLLNGVAGIAGCILQKWERCTEELEVNK